MEDGNPFSQAVGPITGQPEACPIIPANCSGSSSLALNPEHHHGISPGQSRIKIVSDFDHPRGKFTHPLGDQGRRTDQKHLAAQGGQTMNVGAGHPAIVDVTHDQDGSSLKRTEPMLESEGIQQALSRMLIPAVAGIDDWLTGGLPDHCRPTRLAAADHDHIDPHG